MREREREEKRTRVCFFRVYDKTRGDDCVCVCVLVTTTSGKKKKSKRISNVAGGGVRARYDTHTRTHWLARRAQVHSSVPRPTMTRGSIASGGVGVVLLLLLRRRWERGECNDVVVVVVEWKGEYIKKKNRSRQHSQTISSVTARTARARQAHNNNTQQYPSQGPHPALHPAAYDGRCAAARRRKSPFPVAVSRVYVVPARPVAAGPGPLSVRGVRPCVVAAVVSRNKPHELKTSRWKQKNK